MNTLDRYEILGELGRGAISIVYDARDLLTDDPVALKLIEPSLWAPPTSAAEPLRFLTEAMPEWRLRHPNIVRVYDAGDSDGRLYIAMERLEGRTLRRVLDESPLPGLPRSLRMAAELASGLAHAHERGVVHRYLKPSNIFVFADDRAKITDFGMAPLRGAARVARTTPRA
jgi:serine/threonine-protein kinase